MNAFPVAVAKIDGDWRATRSGPEANRDLLSLMASDGPVPKGFRLTRGEGTQIALREASGAERRIEVDQTNDSWIIGDRVVLKWFTEPLLGPHPAGERLRRLQAAGFSAMPRLWGLVEWQTLEGHWVPVATAVELIPDTTDGWTWSVGAARIDLGVDSGVRVDFAGDLGRLTAAMHLALADSPTGPIADHGDLHVGQVLRAPAGEMFVIDFDGNPTLSPAERVRHRPAAYDVAGMLVSLENVGHVVEHYAPDLDPDSVIGWTQTVHADFLSGYRQHGDHLLDDSLLEAFVLDQIHRELAYADSHLPAWRYVPEAALRRRGLL